MRRKIENETRKLKSSSSHEKTSNLSTKYSDWKLDRRIDPKFSKKRDLISGKEFNESVDTCVFPGESKLELEKISCGMQTDPSPCFIESLITENQNLFAEVSELKDKIQGLKVIVEELVKYRNVAKLKINQEIIEMLQSENDEIKRLIDF